MCAKLSLISYFKQFVFKILGDGEWRFVASELSIFRRIFCGEHEGAVPQGHGHREHEYHPHGSRSHHSRRNFTGFTGQTICVKIFFFQKTVKFKMNNFVLTSFDFNLQLYCSCRYLPKRFMQYTCKIFTRIIKWGLIKMLRQRLRPFRFPIIVNTSSSIDKFSEYLCWQCREQQFAKCNFVKSDARNFLLWAMQYTAWEVVAWVLLEYLLYIYDLCIIFNSFISIETFYKYKLLKL